MINFPQTLIFDSNEILIARKFAESKKEKLNSFEGTFRGELAEICLAKELEKKYMVFSNEEEKTNEYEWDLKIFYFKEEIKEIFVDVKTSAAKTITFSNFSIKHERFKQILFPCYEFKSNKVELIGVLLAEKILPLLKNSKYGGYYIWNDDIRKNSIQ